MARKALGRGLDALIPAGAKAPKREGARLQEIAVEKIRPNPRQPRDHFDDSAIDSIAESLRRHGVLQPLVVRASDAGYELIAGERRWRAAQRAGLERVPVVIRDVSATESLELALIENVQREDLNAIEEARAYELLIDEMGLTQEQVAKSVGRGRATIANYLRLLKLPGKVQAMVVEGALEMGHARALLALAEPAEQTRLGIEAATKQWSVRQVEARAKALASGKARGGRSPSRRDPDVEAAERKLTQSLGTDVKIRGKERGRVEIRFTSLEELNRLYEALLDLSRS